MVRTGAPRANARMAPAVPMPMPISAEPEITAWMVSPAPWVPKLSSARPCLAKMPAFMPSVGAWLAQASIWPIAILMVSAARAAGIVAAIAATSASARNAIRVGIVTSGWTDDG